MLDKKTLRETILYEKKLYSEYMFPTQARFLLSRLKREPARMIYDYLVISRKTDFYYNQVQHKGGLLNKLFYLFFISKRNRYGEKLGLEIDTRNIGKGLFIYHYNNVINSSSVIGENCHLHGDNCIGNNGKTNECPVLGNNVSLGVGAKIIGGVKIANGVTIAAGAVVVNSFLEEGAVIGGVPAKLIKKALLE